MSGIYERGPWYSEAWSWLKGQWHLLPHRLTIERGQLIDGRSCFRVYGIKPYKRLCLINITYRTRKENGQ